MSDRYLPFDDRADAGRRLADLLRSRALPPDTVVLGIPRGGVPVAAAIADELGWALDVLVAHKLGSPYNPEFAVGAVAADGTVLVEPWAAGEGYADERYLRDAADREIRSARERETRLRAGRPPLALAGRTVVIVDDGIATGATVHVAVLAARAAGAASVIVAAPVAAPDSAARLRRIADDVVTAAEPPQFFAVGQWYARFDQVDDAAVARLLSQRRPGQEAAGRS